MLPSTFHPLRPILILDKQGLLGSAIANHFPPEQMVILLTNAKIKVTKNIIHLPFGYRIPRIPDNIFSAIIAIDFDKKDLRNIAPSLIRKSKENNCQVVFLNDVYAMTITYLKLFARISAHASLLLYADIFSDTTSYKNKVEKLLIEVAKTKQAHLKNSGIQLVYPVAEDDAIEKIMDILSAKEDKGIYCLFSNMGTTELTIARILHTIHSEMKLTLSARTELLPELLIPSSSVFLFDHTYSFKDKLCSLSLDKLSKLTSAGYMHFRRFKHHNKLTGVFAVTVIVMLLLIFTPLLFAFSGKVALEQSIVSLENANDSRAVSFAQLALDSFNLSTLTFTPLSLLGNTIGIGDQTNTFMGLLDTGSQASKALISVDQAVLAIRMQGSQSVTRALADMKYATTLIQQLQAEGKLTFLSQDNQSILKTGTDLFSQLYPILPDLLGYSSSKQYLILFLNSNELRPGGGFIGSYGLITLKKGQLAGFSVHDIYDIDGQLQGRVSPPEALQQYLGTKNWFLRDSNFSVDPLQNASLANYFYNLETNSKVDGVITIDTYLLQNLLKLTGPIDVPNYDQTVTDNNFFQITEDHAEKNFFPGSSQKKSFLSSFSAALIAHLSLHTVSGKALLDVIQQGLLEKHINITLTNPLDSLSLDKTILGVGQSDLQLSSIDFFGLNEANLGLNKSNHYLQRSFTHTILFNSGGYITHTVMVNYTNMSTPQSAYGGDYKVFIRAVIPSDAALSSIVIDGKTQAIIPSGQANNPSYKNHNFLSPENSLTVFTESVGNKTDYGFFTIVPMGKAKQILFSYILPPGSISHNQYSLELFKQPGTDNDPLTVHIQSSSPLYFLSSNKGLTLNKSSIDGTMSFSQDELLQVSLANSH